MSRDERRGRGPLAALLRVPLLYKILAANALIVVAGAVVGTALTADLTRSGLGTGELVVLMASVGVLLSVLVNAVILRLALSPLREVERTARAVEGGRWDARARHSPVADRDLARLIRVTNEMLDRVETQRRTLRNVAERALGAAERERERVARDLQDDVAQGLAALLVRLRIATRIEDPGERARSLEALREELVEAVERVRRYARDLRPPALEDLGLVPALEGLARRAREEGVNVRVDAEPEGDRLAPDDELALYRMVQEAFLNALRHASAEAIVVRILDHPDGAIVAEVEDDGVGFDPAVKLQSGEAVGLAGLQERASYLGGSVDVESAPGKGTTVRIVLPSGQNRSPFASRM